MNIPAHFIGGPRCGDETVVLTTVMPYPPEYRFGADVYDLDQSTRRPRYVYRKPEPRATLSR